MAAVPPPAEVAVPMVPVVGPQFCMPYMVALTLTKNSGTDLVITDVNGTILMKVQHRKHRVLCDAAGTPIISMKAKTMSLHDRWNVYRGDSKDESELLFTVKRSHMFQQKTELDVFLAGNTAEQHCDFKIKARSGTFYLGESNTIIALMSQQNKVKNVTVYPHVDYAFIVAIIVILYEIGGSSGIDLNFDFDFDGDGDGGGDGGGGDGGGGGGGDGGGGGGGGDGGGGGG